MKNRQYSAGMTAFFLSGICAISAGILVSLLRDRYAFSYSLSGTLVSVMSIGNMLALLVAGVLPARIGEKATTLLFTCGYCLGYLLMAFAGNPAALLAAFLLAGLAKGCTNNKCTVLVGNNTDDRARSMNVMHALFALGALLCPFLISGLGKAGDILPMLGVSAAGLLLWLAFLSAGLPGKTPAAAGGKEKTDYAFLKNTTFWILAMLLFCQNAAEYTVNGWLVTYYKNERILSGTLAAYTVTVQWALTLAARLLLAYVLKVKRPYRALSLMGVGLTLMYAVLLRMHTAVPALIALGLFSFAIAGVFPIAVACVGEMLSSASVGFMLSFAGIGGILFPWLVGIVADAAGLRSGMAVNLIPCAGIILLPLLMALRKDPK
jgi:Fucose permease